MTTTFLSELKRLKSQAVNGPIDGYIIFLINRADAIAELVRVAEKTVKDFNVPRDSMFYSDLNDLEKTLDKLNGGKNT